jgi:preprotein translocase subunit SecG
METVLIVVHLMVVLALVGVVLLQRSEGGGLGIGGGSGFMTARGAANALTRATAILAAAFFATSLVLSIVARYGEKPIDILDRAPATQQDGKGILDQLPGANAPVAPADKTAPTPPSGNDASANTPAPATAPATAPAADTTAPAMAPAAPSMAPSAPVSPETPAQPQVPNQ